jgi:hypothetical protein
MHSADSREADGDWLHIDAEGGLLLLCIQSQFDVAAARICEEIVTKRRFDSRRLFSLAIEHRIAPQIYRTFTRLGLGTFLDSHSFRALELIDAANTRRNLRILSCGAEILDALENNGGMAVLVKGPALEAYVYGELGRRVFKDIDFLTRRKDAGLVDTVLRDLGFSQGRLDEVAGTVIPASREEIVRQMLNTHEAFEYVKAGETLERALFVDVNFEALWKGVGTYASQHTIDTEVFLDNSFKFTSPAGRITVLKPEFQAIQLAAHLFSEAVFFQFSGRWARDLNDVSLLRFTDIYTLIKRIGLDWPALASLCNEHDAKGAVGYAFYYVERLFPGTVPTDFSEWLEPDGSRWIERYMDDAAVERRWKLPFEERIFAHLARAAEVAGHPAESGLGERT